MFCFRPINESIAAANNLQIPLSMISSSSAGAYKQRGDNWRYKFNFIYRTLQGCISWLNRKRYICTKCVDCIYLMFSYSRKNYSRKTMLIRYICSVELLRILFCYLYFIWSIIQSYSGSSFVTRTSFDPYFKGVNPQTGEIDTAQLLASIWNNKVRHIL